jgi:hypothetical protein
MHIKSCSVEIAAANCSQRHAHTLKWSQYVSKLAPDVCVRMLRQPASSSKEQMPGQACSSFGCRGIATIRRDLIPWARDLDTGHPEKDSMRYGGQKGGVWMDSQLRQYTSCQSQLPRYSRSVMGGERLHVKCDERNGAVTEQQC